MRNVCIAFCHHFLKVCAFCVLWRQFFMLTTVHGNEMSLRVRKAEILFDRHPHLTSPHPTSLHRLLPSTSSLRRLNMPWRSLWSLCSLCLSSSIVCRLRHLMILVLACWPVCLCLMRNFCYSSSVIKSCIHVLSEAWHELFRESKVKSRLFQRRQLLGFRQKP